LRRALESLVRRPVMDRDKVLAAVVTLLDHTLIRVGNEVYAGENDSFGLTTLRKRHADVHGDRISLRFRGKGQRMHELGLRDARLARVVRRSLDVPGYRLFRYQQGDEWVDVGSEQVNAF